MFPVTEATLADSFAVNLLDSVNAAKTCRLAYHRMLLVIKGEGILQIDEEQFVVNDSQLFLLAKGQVYQGGEDLKLSGYEIVFGDCFWERTPSSANNCKAVLFNNAANNQCLSLSESDLANLWPHFEALHEEAMASPYINKLDVLAAFLKIIMIKVANINASFVKGYDNEEKQVFHQFVQLVSQQFNQLHEVADYAQLLHVTARRLSDICRRSSGKGAKEIINGQLVAEAKRQLQFSALAIKEIAYQLNFATPEQFSQFFKKNAQHSPSHYRLQTVNFDR